MTRRLTSLWIIGPGRVGRALGSLLGAGGVRIAYTGRSPAPSTAPGSDRAWEDGVPPGVEGTLLTVPDDEVAAVAMRLAALPDLPDGPVLHTSGSLEHDVLAPIAERGRPVGSLHPLASVPYGPSGVERLRGAVFGIAGEGAAAAMAEEIVATTGGETVCLRGSRAVYHAAAVTASNHVVALAAASERLFRRAGLPEALARRVVVSLGAGALANVEALGAAEALTGPVSRGDVATVAAHLRELSGGERALYCALALEALSLARSRGIPPAAAMALADLLDAPP